MPWLGGDFEKSLPHAAVRGRGAGVNPGNRHDSVRLTIDGEHLDAQRDESPDGVQLRATILDDRTRSIINPVDSPDLAMRWTINPYRGCEHGCIYCYARPTHENLGLSCGLDFETKIVAKRDAPALLARELDHPKWKGEPIVMSGVTDPYQPIERDLRITRACLQEMAKRRQPVGMITKSRLITRDVDLLSDLARHNAASAAISLTTLDHDLAMIMEPRASSPKDRLRAMRTLADAGIPVAVMTAPIIPGLNDQEIPRLLKAAADHGATAAGFVLLRLPWQIKEVFFEWAQRVFPERAGRVEAFIRESRDGALYDSRWGVRQRGVGERAAQIARTFEVFKNRSGLTRPGSGLSSAAFRRLNDQPGLFDGH